MTKKGVIKYRDSKNHINTLKNLDFKKSQTLIFQKPILSRSLLTQISKRSFAVERKTTLFEKQEQQQEQQQQKCTGKKELQS